MTFTIEPMITEGTWEDRLWDDGWTAVTADGKRSAQFEHTILVTDDGRGDPHRRRLTLGARRRSPTARISASALEWARRRGAAGSRRRSPVHDLILEVGVARARRVAQLGQGQVVRGDEADGAARQEAAQDGLGADAAVVASWCRAGSRRGGRAAAPALRQVLQRSEPRDLGVEAGPAGLERVLDAERGAGHERREPAAASRRTGAPASASTAVTPTVRRQVLLPDMLEPETSRAAGPAPPSRTSFGTAPGRSGWRSASASRNGGSPGPRSTTSGKTWSGRACA